MPDCERCDGEGTIETAIDTLACPNCRDVCQWCNQPYDDGEPLGDTGLAVCRPCIRDMATYKESVEWSFHLSIAVGDYLDDPEQFREDIDAAVVGVFNDYGFDTDHGDWDVRPADSDTGGED